MPTYTPEQITEILDAYFNARTDREYIGMRYVPIFGRKGESSIDWDGGTGVYEPLTIVLHEGNSYTSRQYVPVGVDISNTAYWAQTGNYDAQVNEYMLETRSKVFAFETVQAMSESDLLYVGAICHTNGFHTSGDGGAAYYTISDSLPEGMEEANGMDVIACGALFAVLQITRTFVTPEMFGAYGDRETNDYDAFNRCFEIANEIKANVALNAARSYFIEGDALKVKTSVIGNGSRILVDNSSGNINLNENIITVESDSQFGVSPTGNCYVHRLYSDDENYRIWKRIENGSLNGGVRGYEGNVIINDQTVYDWFFGSLPSPTDTYREIDNPIYIKDVTIVYKLDSRNNDYYSKRSIQISRDNVTLDNVNFELVNDNMLATRILGLIRISQCFNTILNNCTIPAMHANSSYGLHVYEAVKVTVSGCSMTGATETWGVTAFNGAKDVTFDNCIINRIDAHEGFFGLNVSNCTVGYYGINLTGGWYANVSNCIFENSRGVIHFREDYGSGFNGTVSIKNVTFKGYLNRLIYLQSQNNYDFGFAWKHPIVDIENVYAELSSGGLTIFDYNVTATSLTWFTNRNAISVKDVRSNRNVKIFNAFPLLFGGCDVFVSNVYARGGLYTTITSPSSSSDRINFYINNSFIYIPNSNNTININLYADSCILNNLGFIPRIALFTKCSMSSLDNVFTYVDTAKRFSLCNMGNLIKDSEITQWHDNCFNYLAE